MSIAKIVQYRGSTAISVNNEIIPPMAMTVYNGVIRDFICRKEIYSQYAKTGIRLYFINCSTEWLCADAHRRIQTEVETILGERADAYIILRIAMHPPKKWVEENIEECVTFDDGKPRPLAAAWFSGEEGEYPGLYSLCSQKWRDAALAALKTTLDFVDKQSFADRIIGYMFTAGGSDEWYYLQATEEGNNYADFSKPFKLAFSKFLKEKYQTDENLVKAWKKPATIADPPIPSLAERFYVVKHDDDLWFNKICSTALYTNGTNLGNFLCVDKHQDVEDFFLALHQGTADSIIYFSQYVKERYHQGKLTGAFYGAFGQTNHIHFGTCAATYKILKSKVVDFLSAPGVYMNRQPGGFTGQREIYDSFRLHNMVYINEDDIRTHLIEKRWRDLMEYYHADITVNILKREFGKNICDDMYGWYYDMEPGGGWYNDPQILALFTKQQRIALEAYSKEDRSKNNEIALIYDDESVINVSVETSNNLIEHFLSHEVARIGAGADRLFVGDLSNPQVPDYKVYIFFNTLKLADEMRKIIHDKLSRNHAVAIWVYGSGVINPDRDPKLSPENISQLTGIKTEMLQEKWDSSYFVNPQEHQIFKYMAAKPYGINDNDKHFNVWPDTPDKITYVAPLFYGNDPQAQNLAYFSGNAYPAVTVKDCEGFYSIFHGAKILSAEFVRGVAEFAGCHIINKDGDVLYYGKHYLTFHSSTSGFKKLYFKQNTRLFEVFQGKYYGIAAKEHMFFLEKGETLLFELQHTE